jgi:hypothetical protein
MTAGLRPAMADYLEVRRPLGYKLARPESCSPGSPATWSRPGPSR